MRYTITREQNGNEVEVEVEVAYSFTSACRGRRDSLGGRANAGPPLEPDSPAEVEVLSVREVATGAEVELSDSEEEAVIEAIWEDVANRADDYDED